MCSALCRRFSYTPELPLSLSVIPSQNIDPCAYQRPPTGYFAAHLTSRDSETPKHDRSVKILLGILCGEVSVAVTAEIFDEKDLSVQSLLHRRTALITDARPWGQDDGFFLTQRSSALLDAATDCIVFCHLPNPRRAPMPLGLQLCVGHMGARDLPEHR